MITISTESRVVTMMNVITVAPENQQRLIDFVIATGESLRDEIPGLISVSLHRSLDGTRIVNDQQWESGEGFAALQSRMREMPGLLERMRELGEPDPHRYEVVYTYAADGAAATPDRPAARTGA